MSPDGIVLERFNLLVIMAVTVGFEPTVGFHPHNFSRVAPSAARTRHRETGYLEGVPKHAGSQVVTSWRISNVVKLYKA